MNPPPYTNEADRAIRSELSRIEYESWPWPAPDEFCEVPLDMFPSLKLRREYVTPCGHKLQAKSEVEELQEINQQIYEQHAKVSIEARHLRRALRRAESDVVITALAGIALLLLVIVGMKL